jgi:serine/threonine protein phosphatase PrpC
MVIVESAGISDIGKKRETNEDRIFVDDAMGLYLVADGMGGHQAGEIASALVVTSVRDFLMGKGPENTVPLPDGRLSLPAGRLLAGIQWSNAVIHQTAMTRVDCRGMGSTVAAVCFADATLVAANVGDSPISFATAASTCSPSPTRSRPKLLPRPIPHASATFSRVRSAQNRPSRPTFASSAVTRAISW